MENHCKEIKDKMIDFKRFGFTLLALSVFLYLGVLLPIQGKTEFQSHLLMAGTIVMISLSALFFYWSQKYYNRWIELNEEDKR
jgi:hypothetical protein